MTLLAWLFGLIVADRRDRGRGRVPEPLLPQDLARRRPHPHRLRRSEDRPRGGTLALPFLHKVDEINMRTMRIEVSRAGAKSLITEDRMRVDVELEFYLRVQPTVDGVATAAQAIGSKSLSPDGVRNLLEGRFIDAIQATGATSRWIRCTTSAPSSCASIRESVRENLATAACSSNRCR